MDVIRKINLLSKFNLALQSTVCPLLACSQTRCYAARKGTREKARKKKVKVEVKKIGFIPHNLRDKSGSKGPFVSKRITDDFKPLPIDDVWISRFYRWKVYDFEDAVQCHRETHHPQIYNCPQSPLHAFVELDMTGVKKNKYVDSFTRMVKIPHEFNHGEERTILVFCKTPEGRAEAEVAGASLVGDVDIVKKIEKGDMVLPDYQFILAHPNILAELVSLKGILKRKFPSPKLGTLGIEIGNLTQTFKNGIYYTAFRDELELDYGWVDTAIGTLDMDKKHLEDNFRALIEDINVMKPKREGPFITRVVLASPPSVEKFKINLQPYLGDEIGKDKYESDSDDEETIKKANV